MRKMILLVLMVLLSFQALPAMTLPTSNESSAMLSKRPFGELTDTPEMITLPKEKLREIVQQAVDEAVAQVVEMWKKSEAEKLEAKDAEIAAVQVSLRSTQAELFWWRAGAAAAGVVAVTAFVGGIYLGVQIAK